MVSTSIVVLAVRQGNPKKVLDWPDLTKPGLNVLRRVAGHRGLHDAPERDLAAGLIEHADRPVLVVKGKVDR